MLDTKKLQKLHQTTKIINGHNKNKRKTKQNKTKQNKTKQTQKKANLESQQKKKKRPANKLKTPK